MLFVSVSILSVFFHRDKSKPGEVNDMKVPQVSSPCHVKVRKK
ncbi:hypothetical protein SAMN02745181_3779 [Rubritalea squalenifaciens DSM 18772]|uniref:Uncharacterized protein n=1 Tax=Rubritalea squalenifaciens DSM 18772 TaxID=1123071 RepID=A0A1M6SBI2_9BACT|nr:hypothetical protein SAMN02745181_3779 [Rubritalea squalenifaciens DSM 18772]